MGICVFADKKRLIWFILPGITIIFLFWQLPTLLKAMPSRYVARLPEPVQALGERGDGVPILPTAPAPLEAAVLLADLASPTPTTPATAVSEPPTPTSIPVGNNRSSDPEITPTAVPTLTLPPTITPEPIPAAVRLEGFQHIFQTWNNCGPATTAMVLSYFGLYLNQADTAAVLKPNPEDRNVSPYQITNYVNEQTPFAALDRTNGNLETVKRLVASGFPVVIELGIEPPGEYRWLGWYGHYLLIVAYDDALEQFWVYDSWFGTSDTPMENADKNGRVLPYAKVDGQWRQFNRHYLVFYPPEQQAEVAAIIGEDMDEGVMWQKSLARTQTELNQEPEDAFLWFNLGTNYNELGEYERAATAFDQARALGLPWRMLWYQFGPYEAYYQVGRNEDVLLLTDVTLKDRPYFEESYYYQGLAQEALGDVEAARDSFQKAANFNPYFQPAVDALTRFSN
jgi:tetratricopeptide (TPR) repeat protein